MKSKIILIIAFLMAIITTILFRQYVVSLENKYKGDQERVVVAVPKVDINRNQKIEKDMLELKEFTAASVHPQAMKKIEEVAGNYALTDIKAGEVLLSNRFSNQFQESELITRKISEGYRAVAIGVNYVESVSNLIQPEDYVDIIYTFSDDSVNKKMQTVTLFEKVRVIAVGKRIIEKDSKNASANNTNATEVEYSSITVELKSEDIVKIVNADERGNIKFVLRSKIAP